MSGATVFRTPSGDEMAVIPLDEYRRLVEAAQDAADARAYDEAKERLASGEDELVPQAAAERLIEGENPIRVWRDIRGLTAKDLAAQAGISAPYLSQIEGGRREGGFETMKRIADALDVTLDDLA